MQLRQAKESDSASLKKLWLSCGLLRPWNDPQSDIDSALHNVTSTILVGECDGVIVSSIMLGFDGHRGWIYYLAVTPDLQKSGYGRVLVDAGEAWLRDQGAWKINLMIREENEQVEQFYHSLGYVSDPRIVMGKPLTVANPD